MHVPGGRVGARTIAEASGCLGEKMTLKGAAMSGAAGMIWDRRNAALEAMTTLMDEKPDSDEWSDQERRLWNYAMAIGRRLERIQ